MKLPRRKFLQLAGAGAAVAVFPRRASALDYPTRSVRFVVGFAPGGQQNIVARLLSQWLSERV